MAVHQDNCEICERLRQCEAGEHPGLIAEMETGFAVLGDSQYFKGYSLLLCKTPATELDELPREVRLKYLEEMSLLAEAVRNAVYPHKLNYECLGNQVHHLHWHIFPRYLDEEEPFKPVWGQMPSPDEAEKWALDPQKHDPILESIRSELGNLLSSR